MWMQIYCGYMYNTIKGLFWFFYVGGEGYSMILLWEQLPPPQAASTNGFIASLKSWRCLRNASSEQGGPSQPVICRDLVVFVKYEKYINIWGVLKSSSSSPRKTVQHLKKLTGKCFFLTFFNNSYSVLIYLFLFSR